MIGAGVAFLMHWHRQDSQVRFVAGEYDFFHWRFLRRDDLDFALLLFQSGDLKTDFHGRFDIAHVEGVGDVLARYPGVVEHREGRLLAIQRRQIFEQHHFRFVAHVQVF